MKKTLMTLMLALGAMIAIPSVANAQNAKDTQKKESTKTECKKGDKAACGTKADCKKAECAKADCKKAECAKADCKNPKACCSKDGKHMKGKKNVGKKGMNPRVIGKKDAVRPGSRDGKNPLYKGIVLTEEQQKKMKALDEKKMAERKAMRAERKAQNKEDIKKRMDQYDKDVEKILDGDQLKQYKTNKAEMDAKRRASGKEKK